MQLLIRKRTSREAGMLTPAQLRAARSLLQWSREKLAEKSGVAAETVKRFEFRGSDPKQSTLLKWKRALEQAGVELIDDGAHSFEGGPGVRFKSAKTKR
jgi:transcriptional regulator with XRE-family HTH domain